MDPATLGLIANVGSQFLGGLVKKRRNPFEAEQYAALNKSRSRDKYYDSMLKRGEDMANRYAPTMQKMADMSIEAANKPLTATDIFKGTGAASSILQQQGDAAAASATRAANARGLGGGIEAGMSGAARRSVDNAIAGNIGQFASNYELQQPGRLAAAQQVAGGMYGQGMNQQQAAMGGQDQNYANRMNIMNQMNAFNQQAEDEQTALTSALGAGIGGYFGQKAGERTINKQLAAQEKSNSDFLNSLKNIGAIGYIPNMGYVPQSSKYNVGPMQIGGKS